jgi:hypothetical protein
MIWTSESYLTPTFVHRDNRPPAGGWGPLPPPERTSAISWPTRWALSPVNLGNGAPAPLVASEDAGSLAKAVEELAPPPLCAHKHESRGR